MVVTHVKPNEAGFYFFSIVEPGSYIVTAQRATGLTTSIQFMYADSNTNAPRVIKGGEKIHNQNFLVVFQ